MDEIILSLLKENGRVILPDFGAIIVKQKSPFKVIFNEFLQYNDGGLIGAVEKNKNIGREEAEANVKTYIKELAARLEKGEEINLSQIGILSKSNTGKIAFTEPGEKSIKDEKKTTENIISKSPVVELDIQKEPVKQTPEINKEINKTGTAKKTTFEKPLQPVVENKPTDIPISSPPAKETVIPSKPVAETPVKPITEYYAEPKRSKLNIILWVALIVIVNGAIIGYFFFNKEIKSIFNKDEQSFTDSITTTIIAPTPPGQEQADTSPSEGSAENIAIEEPQEETENPGHIAAIRAGTKYYIVAGVFRDVTNADNLVKELRQKGFNADKFGKIGQMYAVSYDVFSTKQEADKYLVKIKRDSDPDAWIKVID